MQEERSIHQEAKENQGGASNAIARITLLLNVPTIVKMKIVMTRKQEDQERKEGEG